MISTFFNLKFILCPGCPIAFKVAYKPDIKYINLNCSKKIVTGLQGHTRAAAHPLCHVAS